MKGYLSVDGIKINNKNILSWQQKIGFVSQDTFILKGSVLENIAFGVKEDDYDYDMIKKVLKLANLEEFVAKRNLNYLLDENGKNISGGQIQRIAIARSLYAQSEILIFDEFTSSIDKKNELRILETVKNLKQSNKTIIIISHDLDVFKICDEIFKLNKGVLEHVRDNLKLLFIIPARFGSKGIPRKNLKILNGKPLIFYSINNALKISCKKEVVVSSDSDEILNIATKFGAKALKDLLN